MKHALLDETRIIAILSHESQDTVEISDDLASQVLDGIAATPRQVYHWEGGALVPASLVAERQRAEYFAAHPELAKPRIVTKLVLMDRLDALGKWELFKAILSQLPTKVQDVWALAQCIEDSHPLFAANKETLMAALGITEAELSALFAE